jgi:ribosome-binding factor A
LNEKNLMPIEEVNSRRTREEHSEDSRKAGIASGKARREKKTIQKILADLLDSEIKDSPQFAKLASKMGVESDKSVKDIFTMVCLLNSVKSGNLGDLERLSKLLGEDKQNENADVLSKLDKVIGEVDKLAE